MTRPPRVTLPGGVCAVTWAKGPGHDEEAAAAKREGVLLFK